MSSLLSGELKPNVSDSVLDASALLALVLRETGEVFVARVIEDGAVISPVNYAEVVSRLTDSGMGEATVRAALQSVRVRISEFSSTDAWRAGLLRRETRHLGLSLGDRACLALGASTGLPVVTGDTAWKELDVGVEVVLCR